MLATKIYCIACVAITWLGLFIYIWIRRTKFSHDQFGLFASFAAFIGILIFGIVYPDSFWVGMMESYNNTVIYYVFAMLPILSAAIIIFKETEKIDV